MRRPVAIITATVILLLSGCATSVPLPDGISVDARQTRFDGPLRQVQLSVANGSDQAITVLSAELDSTRFVSTVAFDRPQRIPAGSSRDLPVKLPEATCDETTPADAVTIAFEDAQGRTGTATLPLTDTAVLEAVTATDCFIAAIAAIAEITPPATATWMPGARAPVLLEFRVRPTGALGALTIHDVGATTLFAHVDAGGARIVATPVELTVDASSAPTVIPVRLEPSRCDPHAIAEDKKGTILPFSIEIEGGDRGTLALAVSPEVRASLYDYVAAWCAMAA